MTTPSLEALRKYSQADRVIDEGDNERGIALLEEAVALDTAFAMAWRKLGVVLSNIGRDRALQIEALTKAYNHRDRLTDRERYLAIGSYHMTVTGDRDRAVAAYQSQLELNPRDTWALNNLAILYLEVRDYRRANQLFERAIEVDSSSGLYYGNAITTQVALGEVDRAKSTLAVFAERFPDHPNVALTEATLASSQFDFETAEQEMRRFREANRASDFWRLGTAFMLATYYEVQGRLVEAERFLTEAMDIAEAQGEYQTVLNTRVRIAFYDVVLRGEPAAALERVESALERYPLSEIEPVERPYGLLATFFAFVGEADRSEALLAEFEAQVDPGLRGDTEGFDEIARGVAALEGGDPESAIEYFRRGDEGDCPICILPVLGQAYDAAGETDSVVAIYERYVETPWLGRTQNSDWYALAGIYERLAGLYELRGDPEKAAYYYNAFVELWSEADPDLQPRVEAAQRALERLAEEDAARVVTG